MQSDKVPDSTSRLKVEDQENRALTDSRKKGRGTTDYEADQPPGHNETESHKKRGVHISSWGRH